LRAIQEGRSEGRIAPDRSIPKNLDKTANFFLTFFAIFILHFLKTLLQRTQIGFPIGSGLLFFELVPLGRFYSSRPSSRILHEIVSE